MPDKQHEELESRLRAALAAGEPSPGFAARVARRALNTPPRRPARINSWMWAAAAIVVVAMLAGAWHYGQQHRQQQRAAAAAQQLQYALNFTQMQLSRITDVALSRAIGNVNFPQENP